VTLALALAGADRSADGSLRPTRHKKSPGRCRGFSAADL